MQRLSTDRSGTSDERRRMEAKIQQLEEELDEEQANTETLNERLRRSVQEVIELMCRSSTCMLKWRCSFEVITQIVFIYN